MKCRRVEKLMALFIEGDLEPDVAGRISSHLDWCGKCNWLADEYKDSQSWLRANENPEFDQAFLDTFKASVLSRIDNTRSKPSLLSLIAQHWNRRQVLALSGALLVVLGMVVFYIYQARLGAKPEVVETAVQNGDRKTSVEEEMVSASPQFQGEVHSSADSRPRNRAKRFITRANPLISSRVTKPVERAEPNETATKQEYLDGDSADMLRIEIQTADPNIRIIWFTPKVTDSPQTY